MSAEIDPQVELIAITRNRLIAGYTAVMDKVLPVLKVMAQDKTKGEFSDASAIAFFDMLGQAVVTSSEFVGEYDNSLRLIQKLAFVLQTLKEDPAPSRKEASA